MLRDKIAARRGRQPAVRRGDAGDGRRGGRRGRRPADAAGAARRAPRPARAGRAQRARAGAIEGEIFHRGAVQALAPEETQVTPRLAALVRKELIRPDRPQLAGEDGFRFRHLLIRDAAYDGAARRRPAPSCTSASQPGWSSAGPSSSSWTSCSATTSNRPAATAASSGRSRRRRLAAAARRRLTAGGLRAARPSGLRRGRRACSSAPLRSSRRPRSTSSSRASSDTPCSGQAGPTRAPARRCRR